MKNFFKDNLMKAVQTGVIAAFSIVFLIINMDVFKRDDLGNNIFCTKRFVLTCLVAAVGIAFVWIIDLLPDIIKKVSRWLIVLFPVVEFFAVEYMIDGNIKFRFSIVVFNLILYYTIYLLLWGMFDNMLVGFIAGNVIWLVYGYANYFVNLFRGQPIAFADLYALGTAADVADGYEYVLSFHVVFSTILIVTACVAALTFKYPKLKAKWRAVRFVVLAAAAVLPALYVLTSDILSKKEITIMYDHLNESFAENGYALSFVITAQGMKVEKPDGYDAENMVAEITQLNKDITEQVAPDDSSITPTNIIVVMNESWADLSNLGEFDTNIPYMDYYNSISENAVKGKLHVSIIAGGTCNTEWEVLTGNTLSFLPHGVFAYQGYAHSNEYGLATTLKSQGYKAVAMHPCAPENWNRTNVYKFMDFDEFYSQADYDGYDMRRNFVSDKGDFDFIIDYLENKKKGEKLFIFNVTMQNHGGYRWKYDNFDPDIYADTQVEYPEANTYLSLIRLTDEALEYLIEYLKDYDEDTMLVMFGDHIPNLEAGFYDEIFKAADGGEIKTIDRERRFETPYVIWTNYDNDFEEIGDITSSYLGSYILDYANVEMTEYNKYLLNLSKDIPVIGAYGLFTKKDGYVSFEDERYAEQMNVYKQLQYNYIFDKKNRQSKLYVVE